MTATPPVLWTPSAATIEAAEVTRFARFVEARVGRTFAGYEELRAWSVAESEAFWRALWDFYDVQADGDPSTVLASHGMPGASWFPDVRLSYAEHAFRGRRDEDVAIHHASELQPLGTWTWGRLRAETARIRAGLVALGVGRGDRVAAYLPNVPETLAAFLATSSLGAIWSSCSPDFGAQSVIDRFAQIEPTVLLAVDGYRYAGKDFDRRAVVEQVAAAIPTLARVVRLPCLDPAVGDWDEAFPPTDAPLAFERVPFAHPLCVLYSSGTTGLPKAIVHGTGGLLLEHLKWLGIHYDLRPGDRAFWFTTTGWMMWNALIASHLVGAEIVLWDGSPAAPGPDALWQLAEDAGVTMMGVGAAYIHGCMKAGVEPHGGGRRLYALRAIGSTGSPLSPEGFQWVYDHVDRDVWLSSTSGGTDVCTAFVGGVPTVPVTRGEIQIRHLGTDIHAFGPDGADLVDEVGELVIAQPMPSMPVGFWNDPDGARYRAAYFEMYPGVWRHGDWLRITPRGTCVIYGRSDSTINRGGIRMGTAEIYRAALAVPEVVDALVVDIPQGDDSWMPLFVVLADGAELDDALVATIRARLRADCSPRHVPDAVVRIEAVPRTLSGKVLEVPIKRLLMGGDPATLASRDSLANPEAVDWFVAYAAERAAGG